MYPSQQFLSAVLRFRLQNGRLPRTIASCPAYAGAATARRKRTK